MLTLLEKKCKPEFEDFYRENYARMLSYVRGKLGNTQDAEDLTSEVFLYCYSRYDTYDPEKSSITTWLYLIVNSRVKNYYRDHVSYVDYDEVADVMQAQGVDLDAGVYLEQLYTALMSAIRELPWRQQQIVMMRYFENRSSEEIGQILGIRPSNVRVLLSRALNKLSSSQDEYWKEFNNYG